MRETIRPHDIEGLISIAHVPDDNGSSTVVTIWETKVEAMAAYARIKAQWHRRAGQMVCAPVVETAGVNFWESG